MSIHLLSDFLGPQEVANALGISHGTFYTLVKSGQIPPPDLIIGKRKKWHKSTITFIVESAIPSDSR
jgi:excisionase family DNA binding protein